MQLNVNFRSGIPIYIQIMDQVRHLVANGELQPGDQLPTVRQLASELRVNFNTVARAYRLLDEAGVISTQHGRGTYLLSPSSPESSEILRQQTLEGLTRNYLANVAQLGFSTEEVTNEVERQISIWKNGNKPSTDLAENQ